MHVPPSPPGVPNHVEDCTDFQYQPFWKHNPSEWFYVIERRFVKYRVFSDKDQYFNALKNLPRDFLVKVDNVLKSLVVGSKYTGLKRALIDKYVEDDSTRIKKFFENTSLGTRTPSEFLEAY